MLVKRMDVNGDALGDPAASVWSTVKGETVALIPAPAAMQPTKYISTKWQDKAYGQTKSVSVKALCTAHEIAFRLEWSDPTKNEQRIENTDFPDAVAMLFPLSEDASLFMGGEGAPVNLWYWRADHPTRARSDVANGIGTSRVVDDVSISAQAIHANGRWSVVMKAVFATSALRCNITPSARRPPAPAASRWPCVRSRRSSTPTAQAVNRWRCSSPARF